MRRIVKERVEKYLSEEILEILYSLLGIFGVNMRPAGFLFARGRLVRILRIFLGNTRVIVVICTGFLREGI